MKQSRPFQSFGAITADWDYLSTNGHLDANGWPLSIPVGNSRIEAIWDMDQHISTYSGNRSFTVTWDGTGDITPFGGGLTNIQSTGPNSATFDTTASGFSAWGIGIDNIGVAPNNPTNIKIIRTDHQALYDAGERINPDYLLLNQNMRLLRFMPWQQVLGNGSEDPTGLVQPTYSEWSERATLDQVTFANLGNDTAVNHVPVELCVGICNKISCDGWFNFPHAASDDYVTQFSTYVRDNLASGLVAHFELSNEVWNWPTFNAFGYFLAQGRADWPAASGEADFGMALNAFGKRAAEVAIIINGIYSGIESRRVNVIGGQTDDNTFVSEQVLTAPHWQTYDPGTYVRPSTVLQALCIAPYYGANMQPGEFEGQLVEVAAVYAAGTHIEYINDWLLDPANPSSVPGSIDNLSVQRGLCDTEGVDLLMYEGMRHYLHGGFSSGDALTAFLEFARSDEDAALVLKMWNAWEEVGDGPLMVFSDLEVWSSFGAWTYAEFYGDTSPYSEMLFTLNEFTPNWWGGTGDYRGELISGATDYSIPTGDANH